MATGDWILIAASWTCGALALIAFAWFVVGDRSRGRRRCPKCWHVIGDTGSRRCPECGREAKRERHCFRARRPKRRLVLALALGIGAYACAFGHEARQEGWVKAAPTLALVALMPHLGAEPWDEIQDRVFRGRLSDFERRLVERHAVVEFERLDDARRIERGAMLLAIMESSGRTMREQYPWRSYGPIDDVDEVLRAVPGALQRGDRPARVAVLGLLSALGERGRGAFPHVVPLLVTKDYRERSGAVRALNGFRPRLDSDVMTSEFAEYHFVGATMVAFCARVGACNDDPDAVRKVLEAGLDSDDRDVVRLSMLGLAGAGEFELLREHLDGAPVMPDVYVRMDTLTLMALFPVDEWSVRCVRRGLADPSEAVARRAAIIAGCLGDHGFGLHRDLEPLLERGWPEVAVCYLRAGGAPDRAAHALARMLDRPWRWAVIDAISAIELDSPILREALGPLLVSDLYDVRSAAALAYLNSGGSAIRTTEVVISVIDALDGNGFLEPDPATRDVKRLAATGRLSLDMLAPLLDDDFPGARIACITILTEVPDVPKPLLDRVRVIAKSDPESHVASAAAYAVQQIEWSSQHH